MGVHQRRAPLGDGEQVGGHHRVPQRAQPRQAAGRCVGHPVVVAQQPGGGTTVQACPVPLVGRGHRDQVWCLRVEQGHQAVGEQPQPGGLGRLSHGLRRVHHRGGTGPPVVGAEQAVERLRGAGKQVGVNPGGEVAVECGEGLPGARGAGDLQRAVETGEAHPLGGGPAVVVRTHPAHQLPVAREGAPPVAEAARHGLVEAAGTRRDVVVRDQAHQAVALDRDRPVPLLLDELPEEVVSQVEQNVRAVGGLTQGKQPRPGREQSHDGGSVDDGHTINRIVEPSIESFPPVRAARCGETLKTVDG